MASGKKTGGRKKGALNKRTSEIKEFAQQFGRAAITRLAELGGLLGRTPAASEAAQVSALGMVLDRAYGKPMQAMDHAVTGELVLEMLVKNSMGKRTDDAAPR